MNNSITETGANEKRISPPTRQEQDDLVHQNTSIAPNPDILNTSLTRPDEMETEKGTVSSPEQLTREIKGWRWGLIVISILSSTFLFALDNTIVANVQPVIVLEFKSISKIAWMSSAMLLTATSTNLIWGKLYGQLEAKWMYIVCVLMFEVGSALCGAAPNMNTMIIGRAICGFGGAGMYVGVMTLLAANTTLKERPLYIGSTGLTWGLGTVLGPIVGGAFTVSAAGWRWSFYINLVIGVLCAPIYVIMIPRCDPRPGVAFMKRARELDYVGAILTAGAFVSGVSAISFGGVQYKWSSPEIISMFVCSAVLFTTLGFQQVYTIFTNESQRVFPIEFFRSRTLLSLFACTAAGAAGIFVPIYMIPIFFQFTRSDTALESGVRLLPFIFTAILAIFLNGGILSVYGLYMPWFTAGGFFSIIAGSLMYTVTRTTSVAAVYGYTIILGWGFGLFAQAGFSIAQAVVEPHLVPLAIGFITCGQISGVTIALAIANSIFMNKSRSALSMLLPNMPTNQIEAAIAGAGSSFVTNLDSSLRDKVLEAIVRANSTSYVLTIVAGVVVFLISLILKRERLFMTI